MQARRSSINLRSSSISPMFQRSKSLLCEVVRAFLVNSYRFSAACAELSDGGTQLTTLGNKYSGHFPCKFCASSVVWIRPYIEGTRPFNADTGIEHRCSSSTEEFVEELIGRGFEPYVPRCSTWNLALATDNKKGTLIVLIRRRGVDFKIYNQVNPRSVCARGTVSTEGGELVRNNYRDSEINIQHHVLRLANRFQCNLELSAEYMQAYGTAPGVGKARWMEENGYQRRLQPRADVEKEYGAQDIYDVMSQGDGEDVYLGDGIWIRSDGSCDDRGR